MNANTRYSVDIRLVQIIRKFALLVILVVGVTFAVFTDSNWSAHSTPRESIEIFGFLLIVSCIVGRVYCTLYIGGKKATELVTTGPYSLCRNPLYFFSIIGAVGIGAQQGSVTLAVSTGLVIYCLFLLVIFKEESFLKDRFDGKFAEYKSRVPRLLPQISLWKEVDGPINLYPSLVRTTALDACIILLWLPIAELLEHLHDAGILPVLFRLP